MKPNPQQKCMIINTNGSLNRSLQLLPIINDAQRIKERYIESGIIKSGLTNIPSRSEAAHAARLIGGARYLKFIVPW